MKATKDSEWSSNALSLSLFLSFICFPLFMLCVYIFCALNIKLNIFFEWLLLRLFRFLGHSHKDVLVRLDDDEHGRDNERTNESAFHVISI